MDDKIECPYCYKECEAEDFMYVKQGKAQSKNCEHCGEEYIWDWEVFFTSYQK